MNPNRPLAKPLHTWISVGFPVYLIIFEMSVREFLAIDISTFIAPTIAASGMSLIIDVLKPRRIPEGELLSYGTLRNDQIVQYQKDLDLITLAWVSLLLAVLLWFCTCSMSFTGKYQQSYWMGITLGSMNYVGGVLFKYFKKD